MDSPSFETGELRQVYLLAGLDQEQLQVVRKTMRVLSLDEGQCLFHFGQPARQFFYVRSGQIKLFRNSPDGGEKVIEIIRPGETFAEAVMFMQGEGYPVSAEAIMPSEVLAFDQKSMMDILRGSIDTCFRLMASMGMRLHAQLNDIDQLALHNATFRLVSFLLQQMPERVMASPEVQLTTPKNIIASRLSIQPETLSRILGRLSKQELLEVQGQNIIIKDAAGLRKLVQF